MVTNSFQKKYWPYDEVKIQKSTVNPSELIFSAPWLTVQIPIDPGQMPKVEKILAKLSNQEIGPSDLDEISWLMTVVSKYPFGYFLPRSQIAGLDEHVISKKLMLTDPQSTLKELMTEGEFFKQLGSVTPQLSDSWTWDVDAALDFSKTPTGFDPASLFSIARRYHLLNDLENNQTKDLFAAMRNLSKENEEFRWASALVMRQNHYITVKCEQTLRAALPLAQNSSDKILEFINAESGHHQIIEKGMNHLGYKSEDIEVLDCVSVLMELFKQIGEKNLLAFAMVVDIFERSSYQSEDPFSEVLQQGGQQKAAKQMDIHRDINDAGEHENVAIEFLETIMAVDSAYATQALRLAELLTQVIHLVSRDTLKKVQRS